MGLSLYLSSQENHGALVTAQCLYFTFWLILLWWGEDVGEHLSPDEKLCYWKWKLSFGAVGSLAPAKEEMW